MIKSAWLHQSICKKRKQTSNQKIGEVGKCDSLGKFRVQKKKKNYVLEVYKARRERLSDKIIILERCLTTN